MVYFANNSTTPSMVAGGPQAHQNPYYKTGCGCGASNGAGVTMQPAGAREGFAARENMTAPSMPQALPQAAGSMCTLTATAPPAGCCHPAPLHCDCCNGSGFFRASEAYGS